MVHLFQKAIAIFIVFLTSSVSFAQVCVDGIYYNIVDGNAQVVLNWGDMYSGSITIPESVVYNENTYSVTSIGVGAFNFCTGLTSVTIPNSVTSIGDDAFYGCTGLTSITIPNSVTSIGGSAFNCCTNLLDVYAESLVSPTITSSTFSTYGNLHISLKSASAYLADDNWKKFTMKYDTESLETCGDGVYWELDNDHLIIAGSGAIQDFAQFDDRWGGDLSAIKSITVNEGITGIGAYAFSDCDNLEWVALPSTLTSIGVGAFLNCTSLPFVVLPASVATIGGGAFYGCSNLTDVVNMASTPQTINSTAFSNYANLYVASGTESLYSENNIWKKFSAIKNYNGTCGNDIVWIYDDGALNVIGTGYMTSISSYSNCPWKAYTASITSATFTASVSNLCNYAFCNCSGLTSITIPSSVTSIGAHAFYGCSGLTSITIPNSVMSIGEEAFEYCSGLTSITIPNSVTSIGNSAFGGCSGLTSITIPNSVTSIGNYVFSGCSRLTSLTIPNSVTTISDGAFNKCSSLTSITIPNSVTSIGREAFCDCSGLTSITIPNSVTSIDYGVFYGCSGLTSVTIGNSVGGIGNASSIGNCAFSGCTGLTSVTIGNSVTSIGSSAFYNCSGLTSITIPNSVTTIRNGAFSSCTGLTSINVESGNTKYDSREDCNAIIETSSNTLIEGCKNTIIPNSVTSIGSFAFEGCSGLTSITIPNSVTSIGGDAFKGCTGLTSITIPNSVTSIGSGAFERCSGLTSITIGNSVTSIGNYVFFNCSRLTSLTIPNSVTSIGDYAFQYCSKLEDVYNYSLSPQAINSNVFTSVPSTCTIHVRKGAKSAYEAADVWKNYTIVGVPYVSLTDDAPEIAADNYLDQDIEYTRTGSAIADGNYGSFCLPYDIDLSTTNCFSKVYVPVETAFYNSNTNLLSLFMKNVDLSSTVAAGTPFLALLNGNDVALDNSGEITFESSYGNPATTQLTVFDFAGEISGALFEDNEISIEWGGTYKKTAIDGTKYTFKTNGNFVEQTADVNPFRAYLVKNDNSGAKAIGICPIFSDGETTGIEQLITEASEKMNESVKVYTIDGRQVGYGAKSKVMNGLGKGMYIINGKKIIK